MTSDERVLWEREEAGVRMVCAIRDCCTGAELQVRRWPATAAAPREGDDDAHIVLREVYPLKSDLYERAAELKISYQPPECSLSKG